MSTLRTYLRAHRKQGYLSQGEVAYLLGLTSQSGVSQHEMLSRLPELKLLLKYELLYGRAARELYPELHAKAQSELVRRLRLLVRRLARRSGQVATRKCELLRKVQARIRRKA